MLSFLPQARLRACIELEGMPHALSQARKVGISVEADVCFFLVAAAWHCLQNSQTHPQHLPSSSALPPSCFEADGHGSRPSHRAGNTA